VPDACGMILKLVVALVDDSATVFVSKPARCIGRMIFPKEICLSADFPQTVLLVLFLLCNPLPLIHTVSLLAKFHIGKGGVTIAMLDSLRVTKAFLTTEDALALWVNS